MSRNLNKTVCAICTSPVILDEIPRDLQKSDTEAHYAEYAKYGMVVAKAHCDNCNAKYLAWVSFKKIPRGRNAYSYPYSDDNLPFFDLSFRNSFSEEPSGLDLPTKAKLRDIHLKTCSDDADRLYNEAAALALRALAAMRRACDESPWEDYRQIYPLKSEMDELPKW